jgi:hypothetical protein
MAQIDKSMAEALKKQLKKDFAATQRVSGYEAIKYCIVEIREGMSNGYRLDDIAETISQKLNISALTVRGYLYGKASVFNDPDVIKRLKEAGLDGPVRNAAPKKTPTPIAGARKGSMAKKKSAKPPARKSA